MRITIFGLSITSAWGNGHATTFRALCSALHNRGHKITFFEKNTEWYENNRDLPEPPFCEVRIFDNWKTVLPAVRRVLRESDVALAGSYFPEGVAAINEMLASNASVKAFYDIDTPITVAALREGEPGYILKSQLPELDVYFSFTGGPMLAELRACYGVSSAAPLYCSFDPEQYRERPTNPGFACDLSYMGTYAPDRQPKLNELLNAPAIMLPRNKFIVAGSQYPQEISWPGNVRRITHLNPVYHAEFYSSSRLTLNVTRRDMVMAGFSPSVRLFEAAACGAAIISDNWPGLETFLLPGQEVLLPASSHDVVRFVTGYDDGELRKIGRAARERVLAAHTNAIRACEFEQAVEMAAGSKAARVMAI